MTHIVSARLGLKNKVLDADYYARLQKEAQKKKPKPKNKKYRIDEKKLALIAADIRTMSPIGVLHKWRISPTTFDKIYGDMSVGQFGGL